MMKKGTLLRRHSPPDVDIGGPSYKEHEVRRRVCNAVLAERGNIVRWIEYYTQQWPDNKSVQIALEAVADNVRNGEYLLSGEY